MENLGDIKLKLLYPEDHIQDAVRRLADRISDDYEGEKLHLIIVLKGAFIFAADLARRLRLPVTFDFIRLSSYCGMETTGDVSMINDCITPVRGKHLLVVEDIVDTGTSLQFLLQWLVRNEPKSLRVCALIDKRGRRRMPVVVDYAGIVCDDGFLVGYGLDLDERCRELPGIYEVVTNQLSGGLDDSPM